MEGWSGSGQEVVSELELELELERSWSWIWIWTWSWISMGAPWVSLDNC